MLGTDSYQNPVSLPPKVHAFIVGQTGMGKSTLIEWMLDTNQGILFFGHDREAVKRFEGMIARRRTYDVIHHDPADPDYIIPIPLAGTNEDREIASQRVIDFFRGYWHKTWGPRLEWGLSSMYRAALFSSDIVPPLGLASVYKMLGSSSYRDYIGKGNDIFGKQFFDFLKSLPAKLRIEALLPIINKVDRIMQNPDARATFCQEPKYSLSEAMDRGQVIILDIDHGQHGDMGKMYGAAMFTAITREASFRKNKKPFYIVLDECQTYTEGIDLDRVLGTSRKHGLFVIMATTDLNQMDERTLSSIFTNSGFIAAFRTSAKDSERLAGEMGTLMQPRTLQELPQFHCLFARRGEATVSPPDIMRVLPPRSFDPKRGARIRQASLRRWGRPRWRVLKEIEEFIRKPK